MEERIKEALLKVTIDVLALEKATCERSDLYGNYDMKRGGFEALADVLEVNKKRYLQEVRKAHKSEIEKCAKNWVEIPF